MSRLKKWNKNYKGNSIGNLHKIMKENMKRQLADQFNALEQLENAVKKIMGESGLPTWHNIPYLNFARQVYRLKRRFTAKTLNNEIALTMKLWRMRQLKSNLLIKIRDTVLTLPSPESSPEDKR